MTKGCTPIVRPKPGFWFPPGNALEALKRDRRGQHSIRVNEQFRICFVWTADGPEQVEIADYH